MPTHRMVAGAVACLALASCGDNLAEQAVFGAAAGGVAAETVDRDVVTGAAVGAAANIAYCRRWPARC
ncbi:hypothetical protein [Pseudoponticoccus marisrubri]|uniref:Lipoprotein n=1 Tax=Pseudoponticoccus marisrubri TaxID=1685382 RepID=A0A0W7WN57_9RHOB|nr:hypothetical protein [Pseudoponticoccus marisrubri]KUF12035.1 hypothetical protein AVJ23_05525 [Pseudoponticoccus marisrubri]